MHLKKNLKKKRLVWEVVGVIGEFLVCECLYVCVFSKGKCFAYGCFSSL